MDWLAAFPALLIGAAGGAAWALSHVSKSPEEQERRFLERFWETYFIEWHQAGILPSTLEKINDWWNTCERKSQYAASEKEKELWLKNLRKAEALQDFIALRIHERACLVKNEYDDPPKSEWSSVKFRARIRSKD